MYNIRRFSMKKYINIFKIHILFFILFFILLYFFIGNAFEFRKDAINDTSMISIVAIFISLYFGILKERNENDRIFKDLFESFNNKYNGEMNDLFNELRRNPEQSIESINENGKNIIIDYFNLCSEEYLWYTKGRIPTNVWKAWKHGIIQNISIQQVKDLYREEIKHSEKSYYGLAKELNIK
jgi:hypothetical protein